MALIGAYFAEKLGYRPKLLFLLDNSNPKKPQAHAMTLLEKKENKRIKYGAIDRAGLFPAEYDSVEEIIKELNKYPSLNFSHYGVLDLDSLEVDWKTSDKDITAFKKPQILLLDKIDNKGEPIKKIRTWTLFKYFIIVKAD